MMASDPTKRRPLSPEQKAEVEAQPYETGFGKPPRSSRFAKGTSGNPSGRPKEARSLRTDFLEILDMEVTVQLPSGPTPMSMQRAMMISLMAKAAKGDVRATQTSVRLLELTAPERLNDGGARTQLDAVDQAMVNEILSQMNLDAILDNDSSHSVQDDEVEGYDWSIA